MTGMARTRDEAIVHGLDTDFTDQPLPGWDAVAHYADFFAKRCPLFVTAALFHRRPAGK